MVLVGSGSGSGSGSGCGRCRGGGAAKVVAKSTANYDCYASPFEHSIARSPFCLSSSFIAGADPETKKAQTVKIIHDTSTRFNTAVLTTTILRSVCWHPGRSGC